MKLLLDEHFSPEIARILRDDYGRDALAVAGSPGLAGLDDAALLVAAHHMDRALVTEDAADFLSLARHAATTGQPHSGLILTSARAFPRSSGGVARIAAALERFLSTHPTGDSLADQVVWLAQPSVS